MKALMLKLWNDESGATMVEYGLMIALIAVVCIGAVRVLGQNTQATFQTSSAALAQTNQSACQSAGGTYTAPVAANPATSTAAVPESCTF